MAVSSRCGSTASCSTSNVVTTSNRSCGAAGVDTLTRQDHLAAGPVWRARRAGTSPDGGRGSAGRATHDEGGSVAQSYVRWLESVSSKDVSEVGGKNASLGEMIANLAGEGVRVPDGFA